VPSDVDDVRSRTDIVALIGQRVLLRRTGRTWKGLCPFHDDRNPSMQVDPDIGRYRCWACGAKGDAFDWVMATEGVEFGEALRMLAREAGVELSGKSGPPLEHEAMDAAMAFAQAHFRERLAANPSATAYLEGRGITKETADAWGLGYAEAAGDPLAHELKKAGHRLALCESVYLVGKDPSGGYYDRFKGRIMFPIHDVRGRLVAFGGRAMGDAKPKYINSGDTPLFRKSKVLYAMHHARQAMASSRRAVLAEGYLDVIALHQAGVKEAVAPLGTALGPEHAKTLRRWAERAVLVFDGDDAGLNASERSLEVLGAEGLEVGVALLRPGDDPDSVLRRDGPKALAQAVASPLSTLGFRLELVARRRKPTEEAYWREAVQALAATHDHLALASEIERLARTYPGTRDVAAAKAALHRMVEEARESRGKPAQARAGRDQRRPVRVLEAVPFLALFQPSLVAQAWEAARRPELFYSQAARTISEALAAAFGDSPPAGNPAAWLPKVADPTARGLLEDLALDASDAPAPVDSAGLEAAVARLQLRSERRARAEMHGQAAVDDSVLQALSDRLRASAGHGT
jgi:DNA primase